MSDLVGNPEDQFSGAVAHVMPSIPGVFFRHFNQIVRKLVVHEPRREKKGSLGVSDQVRHKLVCAATEDGYKLEISDLERRGIVLSV